MYFLFFIIFKLLLSINFYEKIKYVQTDWDSEYHKLNTLFQTISIHHRLIYPSTYE